MGQDAQLQERHVQLGATAHDGDRADRDVIDRDRADGIGSGAERFGYAAAVRKDALSSTNMTLTKLVAPAFPIGLGSRLISGFNWKARGAHA